MAAAYLEVRGTSGLEAVALDADRVTLGRGASNDVPLPADGSVSRRHAVIERYPTGWCVRDLGSSNGTYLNGERVTGAWLHPGDEIMLGESRLVFRAPGAPEPPDDTITAPAPPQLTRRERDVLVSLCRPLESGKVFTEPATIREVSQELGVTEATVKGHLAHLYTKFGIENTGAHRRVRLANEAIRRRAVFLHDLSARVNR